MRSARSHARDLYPPRSLLRAWVRPMLGLVACLGMLSLLPLSATKATDAPAWMPRRLQSVDATIYDLELTLRARKALLQDDKLAVQNLGVTVRERVAILWGTVPSKELSQRAEEFLRPVLGLQGVRNELRIDAGNAPAPDLAQVPRRPPTPLADSDPNGARDVAGRPPAAQWSAARQEQVWRPVIEGPSSSRAPTGAEMPGYPGATTDHHRQPLLAESQQKPGGNVQTLRPRDPTQPTGRSNPPLAVMPPIAVPEQRENSNRGSSLAQTIDALRLRDPRFQNVQAQVAGGVVTLRGTADSRERLFELAQIVSRIPGVERVVVEEVRDRANP
jgi:hypothetical protein